MTYEEFKITLTAQVTNMVGEEVNVNVRKIQKNNGVFLDAITIMPQGVFAAPSIYLQDLYENYKYGISVAEIAAEVISISEKRQMRRALPDDFFMDYQKVKERICYRVINYEKNRELLKTLPHRKVLDLAMVYYYRVDPELLENASVLIRNVDLQRWEIEEEKIRTQAELNTPRMEPWQLLSMDELMEEIMSQKNVTVKTEFFQNNPPSMFILTNKDKFYGASCILYPDVLERIAEQVHNHFYILPSSIHECIITPVSRGFSQKYLSKMVADINRTQLNEIEVLSDCAYFYNRDKKELVL